MRVLVWQWGKRGAGPRFGVELARGIATLPGHVALLSLSTQAEIMVGPSPPPCDLPMRTYRSLGGLLGRVVRAPFDIATMAARLRVLRPDAAVCAMAAPLDFVMVAALRRAGVPYVAVVHDAEPHPGDSVPLMMTLQRHLLRHAAGLVALSGHVAETLRAQRLVGQRHLRQGFHPPFVFGPANEPPGAHGGRLRLLSFGRLLPYKGLDLLAESLALLGPETEFELRVVGQGPESPPLAALRRLPGVTVENRWVPEDEIGALLAWADALVLSHREASQSGVAAAAIAAGRWVVATRVGGLAEQLEGQHALLCEPDAASLAGAIRQLAVRGPEAAGTGIGDSPDWRELGLAVLDALPEAIRT